MELVWLVPLPTKIFCTTEYYVLSANATRGTAPYCTTQYQLSPPLSLKNPDLGELISQERVTRQLCIICPMNR